MRTSSWPLLTGGFGPTLRASRPPAASVPFCGANILTFFAGAFDAGYHELVTINTPPVAPVMHTWEESLVGFGFLSAAARSTDPVRVEGAMYSGFSSFAVKTFGVG